MRGNLLRLVFWEKVFYELEAINTVCWVEDCIQNINRGQFEPDAEVIDVGLHVLGGGPAVRIVSKFSFLFQVSRLSSDFLAAGGMTWIFVFLFFIEFLTNYH